LSLKEMQIDQSPFPVNTLDLENPAILIRLKQADMTKGKNVVVGDPRPKNDVRPTPSRKVVMEKLLDGEETITITIRGSVMGSNERNAEGSTSASDDGKRKLTTVDQEQVVKPPAGRSDRHGRPDRAT
jgi:hypothetical protein